MLACIASLYSNIKLRLDNCPGKSMTTVRCIGLFYFKKWGNRSVRCSCQLILKRQTNRPENDFIFYPVSVSTVVRDSMSPMPLLASNGR